MSPIVKYSFRMMSSRPLITAFAFVSIVVTAGTLSGIRALDAGLSQAIDEPIDDSFLWVIQKRTGTLTDSEIAPDSEHLLQSYIEGAQTAPVQVGFADNRMSVYGMNEANFQFIKGIVTKGHFPARGASELIVSERAQARDPKLKDGNEVLIGTAKFTIVGAYRVPDRFISDGFVADREGLAAPTEQRTANFLIVASGSGEQAKALAGKLLASKAPLEVSIISERFEKAVRPVRLLLALFKIIFGMIMIGATLATLSNTSLLFAQRTGDMSVLRAIGFRSGQVSRFLWTESLLVTWSATLVGIGVSYLLLRNYAARADGAAFQLFFGAPITARGSLLVLAVMTVVAVIAGGIPIWRLVRAPVTQTLRG